MTQPTTTAGTTAGLIPAQRPGAAAVTAQAPAERITGLRRTLAIVRGLRSLATVPARARISYGESDGQ